jgi:hypothetical protein
MIYNVTQPIRIMLADLEPGECFILAYDTEHEPTVYILLASIESTPEGSFDVVSIANGVRYNWYETEVIHVVGDVQFTQVSQ